MGWLPQGTTCKGGKQGAAEETLCHALNQFDFHASHPLLLHGTQVFFDLLLDAPLQLPGSCQGADSASQQSHGALPAGSGGLPGQAAAAGSAAVPRSMRALEVIAKLVRW